MAVIVKTTTITVTTAGTRVGLSNAIDKAVKVYISAPAGNTGLIYFGDVAVSSTNGIQVIKALQPIEISAPAGQIIALDSLYFDSATSGDKVTVTYLQLTN